MVRRWAGKQAEKTYDRAATGDIGTSSAHAGEDDGAKRTITDLLENFETILEGQRAVGLATVGEFAGYGHVDEAVSGVGVALQKGICRSER